MTSIKDRIANSALPELFYISDDESSVSIQVRDLPTAVQYFLDMACSSPSATQLHFGKQLLISFNGAQIQPTEQITYHIASEDLEEWQRVLF